MDEIMDKISVIVAVYNSEKTIIACVESLLAQSYKNNEIVLVDDGSSDSSLEICRSYSEKNKNITTVTSSKNRGVSETRNIGIDVSSGTYICFVDSDDSVEPGYLEKMYNAIKENNAQLSVCGFTYYNHIDNTEEEFLWNKDQEKELVSLSRGFDLYGAMYLNALWNKMFIAQNIKDINIRFDTALSMGEDTRFTLEYIKNNKISSVVVLSVPLYNYNRFGNTSLMSNFYKQSVNDFLYNMELLYDIVKQYNEDASEKYEKVVNDFKNSLKYDIMRSDCGFTEKLREIRVLFPQYSTLRFCKEYLSVLKEKHIRNFKCLIFGFLLLLCF